MNIHLVLAALAAAAALPAQQVICTYRLSSGSGLSLGGSTDMNRDGRHDVVIGIGGGNHNKGIVEVFGGRTCGKIRSIAGGQKGFGRSVAVAADFDRDGVPDLLVGSPGDGPKDSGAAYIYLTSKARTQLVAQGGCDDHLGTSVASCGDVDGDAIADLLIGAPSDRTWHCETAGYVVMYSGKTHRAIWMRGGKARGDRFGALVGAVGDIDGDGRPDVFVFAARTAQVTLLSGASGTPLRSLGTVPGGTVAGAGDINGDGRPDLVLGFPGASPGGRQGAGEVRVLSGKNFSVLHRFAGTVPGQKLGLSVSGGTDLDGDCWPDIVAGSAGAVLVFSGRTGARVYSFGPLRSPAVRAVGDVSGDGKPDLVVTDNTISPPLVKVLAFPGRGCRAAQPFGKGCRNPTGGAVPSIGSRGGLPQPGNPRFALTLAAGPRGTPALLLAGVSNRTWSGGSLPYCLGLFSMPRCCLLVSADTNLATWTDNRGQATVGLPIPLDPKLIGKRIFFQWYLFGSLRAAIPGSMSDGLETTIIPRWGG